MPTIKINGMRCQHCTGSTKKTLESLDGVSNVEINLEKGEANYDGDIDINIIKEAITKIGFEFVG